MYCNTKASKLRLHFWNNFAFESLDSNQITLVRMFIIIMISESCTNYSVVSFIRFNNGTKQFKFLHPNDVVCKFAPKACSLMLKTFITNQYVMRYRYIWMYSTTTWTSLIGFCWAPGPVWHETEYYSASILGN